MDEQSLPKQTRRPSVEAFSIKLADGNDWGLALPGPRIRPRVVPGVDVLGRPVETIRIATEFGYPLEIRRLIEDLWIASERGKAENQHEAFFRLAASLVRRAHDIDMEEVVGLLEVDIKDLPNFVEAVLSVVTGECLGSADSPEREADV